MAEAKYYWIKLRTDFFDDDSPMDILLSQPNGSEYVCLYLKLCLATANKGGRLCNQYGEMLIPYDIEKIQRDMKYFSIDTVRVALELYQKLGLIYEEADGVLSISGHSEMVGSESASREAIKKRLYRSRVKANGGELLGTTKWTEEGTICPTEYRDIDIRDKEIRDKEIREPDKEKEKVKRFAPPTLDEVKDYIWQQGYSVDAEQWFNYYESNGWMVGRNKMKNWQACIAQWNARDKKDKSAAGKQNIVDKWANA